MTPKTLEIIIIMFAVLVACFMLAVQLNDTLELWAKYIIIASNKDTTDEEKEKRRKEAKHSWIPLGYLLLSTIGFLMAFISYIVKNY